MDMAKGSHRRSGWAAVATACVLVLAGCQEEERSDAGGPRVVAPGRPGEPNRTLSPEQAARERPDDSPNGADFAYVQRMIEHHRQALTMSALAPDRASAEPVKRLAQRIAAAQRPEIAAMEAWLARHPAPGGGHGAGHGHDHASMPGMATGAQLDQLRAARGADFDRLFLSLMTAHHQGAVTMAGEALSGGNNVAVEEMANEVVAQQTSEIERMRALAAAGGAVSTG
ncbi:DUF305 domain-containing protein [Streptomyces sp. NPDC012888]|uniref:DUF305 domain-containing protein n=1 Tax=Streptomyces sp. NPDC012888 TaxID=3364855 RepID=UPI003675A85C